MISPLRGNAAAEGTAGYCRGFRQAEPNGMRSFASRWPELALPGPAYIHCCHVTTISSQARTQPHGEARFGNATGRRIPGWLELESLVQTCHSVDIFKRPLVISCGVGHRHSAKWKRSARNWQKTGGFSLLRNSGENKTCVSQILPRDQIDAKVPPKICDEPSSGNWCPANSRHRSSVGRATLS